LRQAAARAAGAEVTSSRLSDFELPICQIDPAQKSEPIPLPAISVVAKIRGQMTRSTAKSLRNESGRIGFS